MERPDVKKDDWILLKNVEDDEGIEAHVFKVEDDETLFVGYHAYSIRTMKAGAFWTGTYWKAMDRKSQRLALKNGDNNAHRPLNASTADSNTGS